MKKFILRIKCVYGVCVIVVGSIFLAAIVSYAASAIKLTEQQPDYVWIALIFNGLLPVTVLGWIGKRYIDHIKEIHDELIKAKNDHDRRISIVETHFKDCLNCNRKVSYPD